MQRLGEGVLPNHKKKGISPWLILANVSIGTFMATLDGSIANVALPTIATEMRMPLHVVQWVLTAYLLTISATLPIIGKLSDLYGRTRVYQIGFLIFTIGSAGCGFSQSLGMLILSRILQAIGASCLMTNSQAIIAHTFARGGRGQAMGIIGTIVSLGSLTGPGIGGLLVGYLGWPSIFWINIPIGIFGFIAGMYILPKDQTKPGKEPFDYLGSSLFIAGMISLLYMLSNAQEWGWTSYFVQLGIGFALFLLVLFYLQEKRCAFPMLDFSLYRIRAFAYGNIAAFLSFISLFFVGVMMPFYMQNVLGFSPEVTGYTMMAQPLTMAIIAPFSGWLSDKIGPSFLTTTGLLINAFGFFLLNTLTPQESPWMVALHLALFGLGSGMFQSPNNSSIMGAVPKSRLGTAGGLNALVRNVGMLTGITLSVSLFSTRFQQLTGHLGTFPTHGQTNAEEMMDSLHLVFWVALGICIIGALISSRRFGKGTLCPVNEVSGSNGKDENN